VGDRRRPDGRQIELKSGGIEIGHDMEATQGAKPSGQTLSKLERTVNRLKGAIGKQHRSNVLECSVPTRERVRANGKEPPSIGGNDDLTLNDAHKTILTYEKCRFRYFCANNGYNSRPCFPILHMTSANEEVSSARLLHLHSGACSSPLPGTRMSSFTSRAPIAS
jgi:hypothetical protein